MTLHFSLNTNVHTHEIHIQVGDDEITHAQAPGRYNYIYSDPDVEQSGTWSMTFSDSDPINNSEDPIDFFDDEGDGVWVIIHMVACRPDTQCS